MQIINYLKDEGDDFNGKKEKEKKEEKLIMYFDGVNFINSNIK